ncbi:MAG: PilZ domain-containing protein [Acidobacteriota bacterium]|nr:PilZ domain-containing protein [Acidobacteriota bacterium]
MAKTPEPSKTSFAGKRRKSDRVSLSFPIVVSGTDIAGGRDFVENARTLLVSRSGATIVLTRVLGPEQTVFIKCGATQVEAEARVVGQLGIQLDSHIYGVALLDPTVEMWGVRFPKPSEADKTLGRVCLQCISCSAREVVYLTEVEMDVFEANHNLTRSCNQCRDWTLWKDVPQDFEAPPPPPPESAVASLPSSPEAGAEPAPQAPPAPPAAANRRRFTRTNLRKTGCVRQPGSDPDVVQVLDMSRGGIRFESKRMYRKFSWVEIAVPYIGGGAAEVFVPGRIARVLEAKEGRHQYGIEYVR